jgi:hypothetical protein
VLAPATLATPPLVTAEPPLLELVPAALLG